MTAGVDSGAHAALILRIAEARDRQAFAALFGYFAPRLKSYLRQLGAPAEEAEEMAQEVMLTVWRKAGQYRPERAAPAAWIFTIARNLRIDALRRGRPIPPDMDPTEQVSLPLAEAQIAAEQRAARLRVALEALPPEQRDVVQLAFFQDRSHGEIQSTLALPLGTVKSRLRLALAKLRAALGDER